MATGGAYAVFYIHAGRNTPERAKLSDKGNSKLKQNTK